MGWKSAWHHTQMDKRKGSSKPLQMELRLCSIMLAYPTVSGYVYAVKAKLHTYNVTLIKWADYNTPTELRSGIKPNISHLRVFGCQAWVHILKKRRHKDAAHQHFEISCDVKFEETLFPVKEVKLTKSNLAPSSDQPISESDNESDNSGLELVIPAQPPTRPPSPGLHKSLKSKPTWTHTLPHPWFQLVCNLPDQTKSLLCLNLPDHITPSILQRNEWLTKHNPLETISITYW